MLDNIFPFRFVRFLVETKQKPKQGVLSSLCLHSSAVRSSLLLMWGLQKATNEPCSIEAAGFWFIVHGLCTRDCEISVVCNPFGGLLHHHSWCRHRCEVSDLTAALYQTSEGKSDPHEMTITMVRIEEGKSHQQNLRQKGPPAAGFGNSELRCAWCFCPCLLTSRWHKLCQQKFQSVNSKSFNTGKCWKISLCSQAFP